MKENMQPLFFLREAPPRRLMLDLYFHLQMCRKLTFSTHLEHAMLLSDDSIGKYTRHVFSDFKKKAQIHYPSLGLRLAATPFLRTFQMWWRSLKKPLFATPGKLRQVIGTCKQILEKNLWQWRTQKCDKQVLKRKEEGIGREY